ncbi:hypothetical protein ACFWSF_05205 [Streptomyces sp. NPDC058611]|uniref:hypothetical protein n=1 Tax=unclassified Streptomyces TaxID=2593676 RepID=UPI00365BD692
MNLNSARPPVRPSARAARHLAARRGCLPDTGANEGPARTLRERQALACLSHLPLPDAAHLASTAQGREAVWGDRDSALYGSLLHAGMTPVGVVRALKAWQRARATLDALPGRLKQGHGHLLAYARGERQHPAAALLQVVVLVGRSHRLPTARRDGGRGRTAGGPLPGAPAGPEGRTGRRRRRWTCGTSWCRGRVRRRAAPEAGGAAGASARSTASGRADASGGGCGGGAA